MKSGIKWAKEGDTIVSKNSTWNVCWVLRCWAGRRWLCDGKENVCAFACAVFGSGGSQCNLDKNLPTILLPKRLLLARVQRIVTWSGCVCARNSEVWFPEHEENRPSTQILADAGFLRKAFFLSYSLYIQSVFHKTKIENVWMFWNSQWQFFFYFPYILLINFFFYFFFFWVTDKKLRWKNFICINSACFKVLPYPSCLNIYCSRYDIL